MVEEVKEKEKIWDMTDFHDQKLYGLILWYLKKLARFLNEPCTLVCISTKQPATKCMAIIIAIIINLLKDLRRE